MDINPHHVYIVSAAGGNLTALEVLEAPRDRAFYQSRGQELMNVESDKIAEGEEIEQAGFVILQTSHMEMTGGEFCGNASRAGALLLSEALSLNSFTQTVSGLDQNGEPARVKASVRDHELNSAYVQCDFTDLPGSPVDVTLADGQAAKLVDLGGIVHVLIDAPFKNEKAWYEAEHKKVMEHLDLFSRPAVGVCWIRPKDNCTKLYPVVWVRDANTFYYESSCGSGSIAANQVTGAEFIEQPSEKTIRVRVTGNVTSLSSKMEIIDVIKQA